jgi:hypothetical protein
VFGIILISLLAAASSVYSQSDRGIITGVVTDPSGAILDNAKIRIQLALKLTF